MIRSPEVTVWKCNKITKGRDSLITSPAIKQQRYIYRYLAKKYQRKIPLLYYVHLNQGDFHLKQSERKERVQGCKTQNGVKQTNSTNATAGD